jgi:hypothetical protein
MVLGASHRAPAPSRRDGARAWKQNQPCGIFLGVHREPCDDLPWTTPIGCSDVTATQKNPRWTGSSNPRNPQRF